MDNCLGELLKNIRIKNNLSQEELAKSLGYKSKTTINKIELGINQMTYDKLKLLIEKYDVDPKHLFFYTKTEKNEQQFARTILLVGQENLQKLKSKKVAIFGIGGVGGYVVEALARSGISHFILVDNDVVSLSNINRQIIATYDTIGKDKVDVMKKRILSINPNANVEAKKCFYLPQNADEFNFAEYDYVIDCVDTVIAKISIIEKAKHVKTPVISAMGAGNKLNPTMLEVSDIYKTSVDPLAKVMRHELKKRNIKDLKVVYSKEEPLKPKGEIMESTNKRSTPGSIAFVPSVMGLIIASVVIKDLMK